MALLGALSCLATLGFGPPVIVSRQVADLRLFPEHAEAMAAMSTDPAISATAAVVLDVDANQLIYARREHDALPPASTAMIMRALVVLQRASLESQGRGSATAAGTEGSRMGLATGEVRTVGELLMGLLIPSGNDAAVALAEHVAGSEEAFVQLMNETAASMGLRSTQFANSHGLDGDGERSSAADLAALARAALGYPAFAEIAATANAVVGGHDLQSTNQLLGSYPGVDGVKTGTTDLARECLVVSNTRDGHRLLVVILGSEDRYSDARALLQYQQERWSWRRVTLPEDGLAWIEDPSGARYRLRSVEPMELFLPNWQWDTVRILRLIDVTGPLSGTTTLGELQVMAGGQVLAATPLTIWSRP
jgi:D-alanyl-D-alanine carboxypeptidase (penicillin-binding protein 5/6)